MITPLCDRACLAQASTVRRRVCPACRAHVVTQARATNSKAAAAECGVSESSVGVWRAQADHAARVAHG